MSSDVKGNIIRTMSSGAIYAAPNTSIDKLTRHIRYVLAFFIGLASRGTAFRRLLYYHSENRTDGYSKNC